VNTNRTPNGLIHEKSPYLLQHAYNPVNWYPWGSAAFEKAKAEDKPIFLSIGYSTCHWCHVMAHESFEDNEVADLLNKHFISIKVDREERPDIDAIYMATCQALTGQGGWPLTIFMTPEQKPFYAGTYYPKHSRYNLPGILDLLMTVSEKWSTNKKDLLISGEEISNILKQQNVSDKKGELSKNVIEKAAQSFKQTFDPQYGGFGTAPKFPTPHNLMFLMRYYAITKDAPILQIVEKTLIQMYKGGIFDHIGYGFSRYSTDKLWLVPHFEKMLYDNALLTMTYLEAFQITGKEIYKIVAEKIMEYVTRELTNPEGGFYCAQDADSEGVEGKYYVFGSDEIISILGEEDGKYFNSYFDITSGGNFEGKSIPNLIKNADFDKINDRINKLSAKVFDYRKNRTKLHKDDKCLTSWNALMIAAFSKAYKILGDEKYYLAAKRAALFIDNKLTDLNGNLYVRYKDGETYGEGLLDDYSFYIWAQIELYEATFEINFLEKAIYLNKNLVSNFWDTESGGFYLNGQNSEQLIFRPKELYDGAIPSGNSVTAYNLIKLARLTGSTELEDLANRQLKFISGNIYDYPAGYSFYMQALIFALYPSREVVCVLKDSEDLLKIKNALSKLFVPNTVMLIKNSKIDSNANDYELKNNQTTFYVCENNACSEPFNGIENLNSRLN